MGEPSSWSHEVNKVLETRPNSPPLMADKLIVAGKTLKVCSVLFLKQTLFCDFLNKLLQVYFVMVLLLKSAAIASKKETI